MPIKARRTPQLLLPGGSVELGSADYWTLRVSGWFDIGSPLEPNLEFGTDEANVWPDVLAFSFADGRSVITESMLDPNGTSPQFRFSADSEGEIAEWSVRKIPSPTNFAQRNCVSYGNSFTTSYGCAIQEMVR